MNWPKLLCFMIVKQHAVNIIFHPICFLFSIFETKLGDQEVDSIFQKVFLKMWNNYTIFTFILQANPGIFSAGLDITELYQKDADYIRKFWSEFQNAWLKLYGSPLAVIAAVNVSILMLNSKIIVIASAITVLQPKNE